LTGDLDVEMATDREVDESYAGEAGTRSPPTRTVPRSDLPALEVLRLERTRSGGPQELELSSRSNLLGNAYRINHLDAPARCVPREPLVMNPARDARFRARLGSVWLASMVSRRWQSLCPYGGIDENAKLHGGDQPSWRGKL